MRRSSILDRQPVDFSPTVIRLLVSGRDGSSEEELSGVLTRVLTDGTGVVEHGWNAFAEVLGWL